ncbi:MAG: 4Fe-4S binding protein [Candidatus Wallbacteria bacterium]
MNLSFSNTYFFYAFLISVSCAVGLFIELLYQKRFQKSTAEDKITKIIQLLPGTDCGKCSYPSCKDFAMELIKNQRLLNLCGEAKRDLESISNEIWGYNDIEDEKINIRVHCSAGGGECEEKFRYYGVKNCSASSLLWNGSRECGQGCAGFGDCARVCPVSAITMKDGFLPVIDEELCIGCGICVETCPYSVIKPEEGRLNTYIACQTFLPGMKVHKICSSGCINCGICIKACPHHAISQRTSEVPQIWADRCVNCSVCVDKCPSGVIKCGDAVRKFAVIDQSKCNLCGICSEICPVMAVLRKNNEGYKVLVEKCSGCGLCADKCPKQAIKLIEPEE